MLLEPFSVITLFFESIFTRMAFSAFQKVEVRCHKIGGTVNEFTLIFVNERLSLCYILSNVSTKTYEIDSCSGFEY